MSNKKYEIELFEDYIKLNYLYKHNSEIHEIIPKLCHRYYEGQGNCQGRTFYLCAEYFAFRARCLQLAWRNHLHQIETIPYAEAFSLVAM